MEKRIFNKTIKQHMLCHGFEKSGTYDYTKESSDGLTKIVVRAPDQTSGFCIGVQFRDFLTDYADYSGKYSKICMSYGQPSPLLHFASHFDYTDDDIVSAVNTLMERVDPFIKGGKAAIRDTMHDWRFGLFDKQLQNEIYAYFGMPLIDPYSDSYVLKQVEEWYQQGGKSMMSLKEYYDHKEHYDKYAAQGCQIEIGKEFVTIFLKK